MRISNSRIFGYTLDVTPSFVNKVPSSWVEKQTLVTCRRYITEELKNLEKEKTKCVFDAERLENAVYNAIVEEAKESYDRDKISDIRERRRREKEFISPKMALKNAMLSDIEASDVNFQRRNYNDLEITKEDLTVDD